MELGERRDRRAAAKVGAKASTTAAKSDGGAHVDAFLARLVALSGDDKALEGAGSGKRKRGDGESDRSVAETAEELEDGNSRFEDEDREKLVASLREKADVTKAALVGVLDALEAKTAGVGDDALKKRMDALEASRLKTKRDYDALSHAYLRDSARCKELQAELDEMEVLLMGTRRRLAIAKANGGDDTIEGLRQDGDGGGRARGGRSRRRRKPRRRRKENPVDRRRR